MVQTKEERAYMVENKLSAHPSHLAEVLVFLGIMIVFIIWWVWSSFNA